MTEPTESDPAVIEDDITTAVADLSSEPATILLDEPQSRSTSWRAERRSPRHRVPARSLALVAAIGVLGSVAGFLGAWLHHERAVASELRQALQVAQQGEPLTDSPSFSTPKSDGTAATSPSPAFELEDVSIAAAVSLLAQNRQREALAAYRKLSALHPQEPVFAEVVWILEVELRCGDRDWEAIPCD